MKSIAQFKMLWDAIDFCEACRRSNLRIWWEEDDLYHVYDMGGDA